MRWVRTSTAAAALLLGIFFVCLYLLSGSTDLLNNGDTDLRYQTAQAIVEHHRLWIADPMWYDSRVSPGVGGHLYAFYAPGQTLLMVPLYWAGKVIAHHLSLPYYITTWYAARSIDLWLGALLVVVFFLMAVSIGYSRRVAVLLAVMFGMATAAWPDAQSALEQTQIDLFLLLSVYAVWNFVSHGTRNRAWMLLSGAALGACVLTRYDGIIYVPVIALYPAVVRGRNGQVRQVIGDWLAFGIAFAPFAGAILLWDALRFGSPWITGLNQATFGEPFLHGFLGLIVSPGKGLLWYLPLVFLLPWAYPRFARYNPGLAWLFGALIALAVLFYSNVLYWHGDPAWGPRYLYTTIPYLTLPLGMLLRSWKRDGAALHAALIGLVVVSVGLNLAAVSVTQWRFWYRLEVAEGRTSHPFKWGAQYYHYYWNVGQSPILIQLDDVYQVARLQLGTERYRLTAPPANCLCSSNPAVLYPVNSFAFWWANSMHPLLGAATRKALAVLLGCGALITGFLLLLVVLPGTSRAPRVRDLSFVPSDVPGG